MTQSHKHAPMAGSNSHSQHRSGPKSNIFRPPTTPIPSASSSSYLTHSDMSLCGDSDRAGTTISRKRTRYEFTASSVTPVSNMSDWSTGLYTGDPMAQSGSIDPISPMPFVNTRYYLQGGLDTPGAQAASAQEDAESEYYDKGFRKDLGGSRRPDEANSNFSFFPSIETPPSTNNGQSDIQKREGWSRTAFDVVGGVVGKVWEFCKAAPFRGFIAGGGTAYNSSARPITPTQEAFWRSDITSSMADHGISTPIPGQFPEDDYIPDYMDNPTPTSHQDTPPRPSKRRQISNSKPSGDLEKSWIMVSGVGDDKAQNTKLERPKALPSRYSMPTSASSNRRLTGLPPSRASNAAVRRTVVSHTSTASVSHAGSPGLHTRGASFASPRTPGSSKIPLPTNPSSPSKSARSSIAGVGAESPAAKEAARWAQKKKMEERENDEVIRKFNKQLRDMIREGKEALGTKIEVRDEEDEGFEDGY